MSDFLAAMAVSSRARAAALREEELSARMSSARPPIPLCLSDEGFDLITEAKLASPSAGRLAEIADDDRTVTDLANTLATAGPAAISILTEPSRFAGHMRHLEMVAGSLDVPVMRKDFLVDRLQVFEARAGGASGVLLIARILDEELLVEMTDLSLDLGMFVLVEVFDESDLERSQAVFGKDVLVGVNARDLATLAVDQGRHARLGGLLPDHLPLVAESGVLNADDVAEVASLGYRLALVGTGLMRNPHPGRMAAELLKAGRRASRVRGAL